MRLRAKWLALLVVLAGILLLCGLIAARAFSPLDATKPPASLVHTPFAVLLDQAELTVVTSDGLGVTRTHQLGMQALPWRWDSRFARQRGWMQWRFELVLNADLIHQLQTDTKGVGLSVNNIGNRYRYRVNEQDWASVGWDKPASQAIQPPRWHLIAANEFRVGKNVIDLHIQAEPANDAGLTPLELGLSESSLADHARHLTGLNTIATVVAILSLVAFGMSFSIGFVTQDRFFWIVCCAEGLHLLRQMAWLVEYPVVPTWMFNALERTLFAWHIGVLFLFSLHLVDKPAPLLTRLVKIYLCLCLPVIAYGMYAGDYRVYPLFWPAIMLALSLIYAVRLVHASWGISNTTVHAFIGCAFICIACSIYEYSMEWIPAGFGYLKLGRYALALMSIALCVAVLQKYFLTRSVLHRLTTTSHLAAEAATLQERQRIMRDIHDSVGSQLVSLLSMINSDVSQKQLTEHTKQALDELRLAVDAISTDDGDLNVVLATLRHRLLPRLRVAKLHLIWKVDELPNIDKMTYVNIQHFQRIVLEAVSNVIQHSQATLLEFSARYDPHSRTCLIRISDNGRGFDPKNTTGRGLANMHHRANALQAALAIKRNRLGGTKVLLGIPVRSSASVHK